MDPFYRPISDDAFAAVKARLNSLGAAPPQVLLLEGGHEEQRFSMACYWACRLHCPTPAADGSPCLACNTCSQIAAAEYIDFRAFDGRISNTQDTENPGSVRALSMDNVRDLKSLLKDPPHGTAPRVIILSGIEGKRAAAANGLLKALEEPSETSVFVLLAAQREQLLPTLVSRSICITLPWPDPEALTKDQQCVEGILADFFATGRALYGVTGTKGFDADSARTMLFTIQKALVCHIASQKAGVLAQALSPLSPADCMQVSRWLSEAQGAIDAMVTPSRVMEAFTSRLFVLLHTKQ